VLHRPVEPARHIGQCLQSSIKGKVNKKYFAFGWIFVDFQPPCNRAGFVLGFRSKRSGRCGQRPALDLRNSQSDFDALPFEHGQKHQAVFNRHISEELANSRSGNERVNALVT
jgi:hypothetical protein